jgi:hypothetical protein
VVVLTATNDIAGLFAKAPLQIRQAALPPKKLER